MNTPLSEYTTAYALQTYGAWATVEQIDTTLNISGLVQEIPRCSNILNIGSGVHLGINGLIRHLRPDAHITSLDPGYADGVREIVEIDAGDSLVAGVAENLPFAEKGFDFVFGHASVPENMHQHPDNYRALLGELSRVAKNGAKIVLGPHTVDFDPAWPETLDRHATSLHFQSARIHETTVVIPEYDIEVDAQITTLVK